MSHRRRILWTVAALLPAVLAAGAWARSYARRDRLSWEVDRPDSRRAACQLYSSRGRLCFASYSRSVDGAGGRPWSFESGDRAGTTDMAQDVHVRLQQAGVMGNGALGFAWSQHLASMSSGTHVWTGGVAPWWALAVLMATPAYVVYRWLRPKQQEAPAGAGADESPPRPAPAPPTTRPTTRPGGRPAPRRAQA
jgi:hypothetical protein